MGNQKEITTVFGNKVKVDPPHKNDCDCILCEENEVLKEEVNDVMGKLQDVKECLENGKELDGTQYSFLKMHNII